MTDMGRMPRRISASKAGVGRVTTEKPRYGPAPDTDDDFMTRVQLALGMTPKQLANALRVPVADVIDRTGLRASMSSFMEDPFWPRLLNHVNETLAGCLALKEELDRKHRLDRRAHQQRQLQISQRK